MEAQEIDPVESLAAWLSALAEERKMSYGAIGRLLDTDKTNVSRWLKGEVEPGGVHLLRLMAAFGVELSIAGPEGIPMPLNAELAELRKTLEERLPFPEPPEHDPAMDEYLELVEAWDAAGRPESGPIFPRPPGVEEAAAAIRALIVEQFSDHEARLASLEEEASPEEEDPPAEVDG